MENLDDLIKQEFFLNPGDCYEDILLKLITLQLTHAEILRRLVEMGLTEEAKLLDPDKANKEMGRIMNIIAEQANIKMAERLAELAVRNKK